MASPQLTQSSGAGGVNNVTATAQNSHVNSPPPSKPPATAQVAVIMVPLPAQGHLNQLLHLSGRLASSYNIPVHYVGAATHIHQAKLRYHDTCHSQSPANYLHFHSVDVPPFESPAPDPNSATKFPNHLMPAFEAAVAHLRGPVGEIIRSVAETARRVVVVHDSLMASVVRDVGSVTNAESYIFHSVSAFAVYWYLREAAGKRMPLVEVGDDGGGLGEEEYLPSIDGCFSPEFLKFLAWQYEFRPLSSGSLYNTCRLVEGHYLKLLEKETTQNHWAIGPFNPVNLQPTTKSPLTGPGQRHKCLEWLDRHPPNSVIYVSFGTTTTLSHHQIYAIATALEKANQRFIWVLREADKGDIFTGDDNKLGLTDLLPKGYEERVDGVGLIVREWVPQLAILGHPSTGGFMSHCGWNSCMESISMGVPLAAWPMHSDQPRNSVLVTKVLRVGTMVRVWSCGKGWNEGDVGSVEIERAVRVLMASPEGDGMRKRAAALGNVVRESVGAGGVSRAELDAFVLHISRDRD